MRITLALVATASVFALIGPASHVYAQGVGRAYVAGSVGSFGIYADPVDGSAPAIGIAAGVAVTPWLDLELDVVRPTRSFTREYTGTSISFAPLGATREEIERLAVFNQFLYEREVSSSISGVAIFHPRAAGRWQPGFIVGVVNRYTREERRIIPIRLPRGLDPGHPRAQPETERYTRNYGGLTLGGRIAFAVTPRLLVAPDIRYDYGSIGDEIDNALRSSVRVTWRF